MTTSASGAELPTPALSAVKVAREAFVADKRTEAAIMSAPMRRTRFVGTPLAGYPAHFVHLDRGRLVVRPVLADERTSVSFRPAGWRDAIATAGLPVTSTGFTLGASTPLDAAGIIELVDAVHDSDTISEQPEIADLFRRELKRRNDTDPSPITGAAVIADDETFKLMLTVMRRAIKPGIDHEYRQTLRLLEYRAALPVSAHFPVLTQALARAWWLPSGDDPTRLATWAEHFGDGDEIASFPLMLLAAITGVTDYASNIVASEKYGSISSRYVSTVSAAKAYRRSQSLTTAFEAMIALDPALIELNEIEGTVARAVTVAARRELHTQARFVIPNTLKVKVESKVLAFSPSTETPSQLTVTEIESAEADEQLIVTITLPSTGKNRERFSTIRNAGGAVYLTPAPFLGGGKASALTGRWSAETAAINAPSTAGRGEVPFDILIAGAPS